MRFSVEYLLEFAKQHQCISEEDWNDYMAPSNAMFTRPFVITMKKDGERYEKARTLLVSLNANPIRFTAIEGKDVEGLEILNDFAHLKPSEKGCLMSHVIIAAFASRHPHRYTIAFEDDIISSLSGNALHENLHRLEGLKADIVYLGKCFEHCANMQQVQGNIYKADSPYCCHALALRGSFARRFIGEFGTTHEAIDNLYRHYVLKKKALALTFHPALFYQDVLHSTSNNRPGAMDSYTECLDAQVHPSCANTPNPPCSNKKHNKGHMQWVCVVIIVILVIVIAYFIFRWSKMKRNRHEKRYGYDLRR
jgi:GR25 family glycosyltransferase involved in LPS biosynthesis